MKPNIVFIITDNQSPWTMGCEYEVNRTVYTPQWKYTRRIDGGPDELYHLDTDPGEGVNLACETACTDTLKSMQNKLTAFFDRYADPKYDLCKGGTSKAGRM